MERVVLAYAQNEVGGGGFFSPIDDMKEREREKEAR